MILLFVLLMAAPLWAAEFTVTGTVHRVPVDGLVTLNERDQTWQAEFWDSAQRKSVKMYLAVDGTYLREADGDLTLRTPYTDAVIVLSPTPSGFGVRRTTADITMSELRRR